MANLIEGIQSECNRCRAVVKQYESIGMIGALGKALLESSIGRAEAAIASGDIVEMCTAYLDLKKWELHE